VATEPHHIAQSPDRSLRFSGFPPGKASLCRNRAQAQVVSELLMTRRQVVKLQLGCTFALSKGLDTSGRKPAVI
jgi:hypothetical protein